MKQKLLKTMLLLCALVVGSSSVWATDVTYTISSKNTLSTTGTAPTSSSATMVETYSTSKQMTNGNSQTLTLSGWNGYTISSITLSMRSNGSSGAGKLKYSTDNGSSWTYIVGTSSDGVAFNKASWYGSWSTSYVDVSKTSLSIGCGTSDVKIVIEATANSLYCESYTITYAATPSGSEETTTTTIDASGITNKNKFVSTAAGTLTAVVKDESDAEIGGASVTWTSSKTGVATIGSTTGVVTLVGKGTTTIRASYAGVDDKYLSSYDEYELTVTDEDPNALLIWSEDFATSGYSTRTSTYSYTTTGGSAVQTSDSYAGGSAPEMMVKGSGTFSATIPLDKYYGNLTLSYKSNAKSMSVSTTTTGLSTSGTTSFSTAGTHEVTFTGITASTTSITIVYSASENARLDDIELKGRMAAPQFSLPSGDVSAGTSVTLSATAGATIYYTTDGSTPTTSSSTYSSAFTIDETTTIKAIAVKSGKESSVATATFTVTSEPFISLGTTSIDVPVSGDADGSITVTYNNITEISAEVLFYEADGTTPATYDWIGAEINGSTKNVDYIVYENETYASRTAYMKVYALDDSSNDVYSELITITQAGKTIDFVTLPFSWYGGTSSTFTALAGVTASGLGTDYDSGTHGVYIVKLDGTNDYIQIKTNAQPSRVYIGVKMIGGNTTSTITVKASADGSTFDTGEALSISGSQNDIVNLVTTRSFASTDRYIRLVFTKGSNVGVGPISVIAGSSVPATLNGSGYATFASGFPLDFSDDSKFSAWQITAANSTSGVITFSKITGVVPSCTGVLLKKEGASSNNINIPVAGSGSFDVSSNLLKGITYPTTVAASTYYGLKANEFVKVNAGTVPAGKALLPASEVSAEIKSFTFVFNDSETGITETRTVSREEAEAIFNLAGQRIQKPQKGINIINGRKVVVK